MSIKVDLESLKTSINKVTANAMFPGLASSNEELIDKIQITPPNGISDESVQLDYKVDYVVAATNVSAFDKIIDALRQGIGLGSEGSFVTVLNAADLTNKLLKDITTNKVQAGNQQIDFRMIPQPENGVEECYSVQMEIEGGSLISNSEDKTKDELARLTTKLSAQGIGKQPPKIQNNLKKDDTRENISFTTDVGPMKRKSSFLVSASIKEDCSTDGEFGFNTDSISLIHITRIRFVIKVVPCPSDKKKEEQPKVEKKEQPKTEKSSVGNKKIGLKTIDGVGTAKEKLLKNGGVNSITELAGLKKTEIEGISKSELTSYLIPSAKLLVSFNDEEVEGLVKGFKAKNLTDVLEVARKIERAEDLIEVFEASKVKMPSSFNPEDMFLKLKAII